jgi:hypothetical protein
MPRCYKSIKKRAPKCSFFHNKVLSDITNIKKYIGMDNAANIIINLCPINQA